MTSDCLRLIILVIRTSEHADDAKVRRRSEGSLVMARSRARLAQWGPARRTNHHSLNLHLKKPFTT